VRTGAAALADAVALPSAAATTEPGDAEPAAIAGASADPSADACAGAAANADGADANADAGADANADADADAGAGANADADANADAGANADADANADANAGADANADADAAACPVTRDVRWGIGPQYCISTAAELTAPPIPAAQATASAPRRTHRARDDSGGTGDSIWVVSTARGRGTRTSLLERRPRNGTRRTIGRSHAAPSRASAQK
jgi:hypothetical protein